MTGKVLFHDEFETEFKELPPKENNLMPKDLDEIMRELPPERRERIEKRASELIDEHMTLQDIRKAQKLTQERMAQILGVGQDSVSRLEKRTDLHLSTLNNYINAMGGSLKLVAEFPDRSPVILDGLVELSIDENQAQSLDTSEPANVISSEQLK
jgi:transcriptional regulator with XRE-family HTH domain